MHWIVGIFRDSFVAASVSGGGELPFVAAYEQLPRARLSRFYPFPFHDTSKRCRGKPVEKPPGSARRWS